MTYHITHVKHVNRLRGRPRFDSVPTHWQTIPMQPMNCAATAEELRRQEFSRLSAAVTPRIEAFRSMTADAFRTEITLMLERLGHAVISSVTNIVTTKDGTVNLCGYGRGDTRSLGWTP